MERKRERETECLTPKNLSTDRHTRNSIEKMSYSSVVKKNMAASYGGGGGGGSGSKSSNSTYIVQKASGSAYGPATSAINGNASKHSSIQYGNKFTSMKVNSHLLDHGYGATPQTSSSSSYDNNAAAASTRLSSQDDASQFKGYTNSFDAGITKYYKVSASLFHIHLIQFSNSISSKHTSGSSSSSNSNRSGTSIHLFGYNFCCFC